MGEIISPVNNSQKRGKCKKQTCLITPFATEQSTDEAMLYHIAITQLAPTAYGRLTPVQKKSKCHYGCNRGGYQNYQNRCVGKKRLPVKLIMSFTAHKEIKTHHKQGGNKHDCRHILYKT